MAGNVLFLFYSLFAIRHSPPSSLFDIVRCECGELRAVVRSDRLFLLPPLPVPVRRQLAELVIGEEAIGPDAAGVAAIAAPSRKLLHRLGENAAAGVDPGEPLPGLEGFQVGEPAVLVALQPHAAPAA